MAYLREILSVSVLLLAAVSVVAIPSLLSEECLDEISWPDPTNCSRYYVCAPWGPQIMECSGDLQYNPELRICDWPEAVGCVVTTTSTEEPSTVPSTTPVPESTETPEAEPTTTPEPETAETTEPEVEATATPEPESTTPETTSTTDEPESTTVEPESTTVEPESTPEPTSTTDEPESTTAEPESTPEPTSTTDEPESTTSEPESTPEPEVTTDEVESTTSESESTTAEPEPTTPEPEATTAVETEPEPTETEPPLEPTTTEAASPKDICEQYPGLFFLTSYPGDCSRFIVCNFGEPTVLECPDGHVYSPILNTCTTEFSHCT